MGKKTEPVEMKLTVRATTDQAIMVFHPDDEGKETRMDKRQIWLPRSKIEIEALNGQVRVGHAYVISMPEWLAVTKGLE